MLENYDDKNYGYLRIVGYVRAVANRVSSGERRPGDQDPDDFVTVDFKSRKLVCISTPVTSGDRQRLGGSLINER